MDPDPVVLAAVTHRRTTSLDDDGVPVTGEDDRVGPAIEEAFDEFANKTGRRYGHVEAYRCEDAEFILVGMGCYMETARTVIDYLRDVKGVILIAVYVGIAVAFYVAGDRPEG